MPKTVLCCLAIWGLALSLLPSGVRAQLPAAPNGKFQKINGVNLYYEQSGTGTPLLLLHTFFGTTEQWGSYTADLAKHYRVIAVDLPGHGRSDYMDTSNVYANKTAAEYLISLLDRLHIDTCYILGASSGGTIALYMAALRPALVKKFAVVGAQLYYTAQTRKFVTARGAPKDEPDADAVKDHGRFKARLLDRQFYQYRQLYGELAITPDLLGTITAKARIINGDNDKAAPVSNAIEMFSNIPAAHLWVVPNGGHLPHLSAANSQDFLRRILDFFAGSWK